MTQTLEGLKKQWEELEAATQTKAQCLFDANRTELFSQSCSALDSWVNNLSSQLHSDDYGKDLTSVNILLKKHQVGVLHVSGVQTCIYEGSESWRSTVLLVFISTLI